MSKDKKKMRNSKYTREFRDLSVQLVINSDESTAKIAKDLDVNDKKLSIKDSGKGIANPKKVFERFYKEQERGRGIGLHIVAKLIQELHIKIDVKSTLQEGSEFILDLKNILCS